MAFLIDTNIAIHAIDGLRSVLDKLKQHNGVVILSALSLVELQLGIYKSQEGSSFRLVRLKGILQSIPVLPFDQAAAESYGQIIAQIGWVRSRDFDRMIGAHALVTSSILVTANTADFSDIPGLTIEDWTDAA